MHPTRSADIYIDGVKIGYFGQINPDICDKLDVDKPVFAGEIYFDEFIKHFNDKIVFKNISKFPPVERDIAIVLGEDVAYEKVIDCIKKSAGANLDEVALFDIYRSEQIGKNKKSMAFNLIFRSDDRTLNVEEIDSDMNNILAALKNELGAELR